MKNWLKVICAALLLYVAVFSFLTPLVPGGLSVDTQALRPGTNTFVFTGYNTHFADPAANLQVFVAADSTYYCATIDRVTDDTHVTVSVLLPDTLPSSSFSFYANTDLDGTVYVRTAMAAEGFTIVPGSTHGRCTVKVAVNEHQSFGYPFQIILFETIRNLMWHVPMWFTMFVLMFISFAQSLKVLRSTGRSEGALDMDQQVLNLADTKAAVAAGVGLFFCVLGLLTGSTWARFTWGAWWTNDPQLNGAMVVFIMYVAYFILRGSVNDDEKRARLAAIFNIFACVLMVILLMIMPRFAEGLHPGKSGNPAFSSYDLDSSLRTIFYPAVLGWILLGYWLYSVRLRLRLLEYRHEQER